MKHEECYLGGDSRPPIVFCNTTSGRGRGRQSETSQRHWLYALAPAGGRQVPASLAPRSAVRGRSVKLTPSSLPSESCVIQQPLTQQTGLSRQLYSYLNATIGS